MSTPNVAYQIMAEIKRHPPLSGNVLRLLEVTNDSCHRQADVIAIVKHDAALTAGVLRTVNSAAYARRLEITAIEHAVSMLGEDVVVGIALSGAAAGLFSQSLAGYEADRDSLWAHDLQCAIAAKAITAYGREKISAETAFTCGLLHDIGKAILSDHLLGKTALVLNAIDAGKIMDFPTAEKALLGLDHSQVGYELALHWGLPEPIPSVIRFHHEPSAVAAEIRAMTFAVHLGDIIASMIGISTGADSLYYHLDKNYAEYMDLSNDQLALVISQVTEEFSNIQAALGTRT